jgi:hypothetical protein
MGSDQHRFGILEAKESHELARRPKMRAKLTYSNVVSTLCLFLLLGGGAAYAVSHLGKNSVGTKQLKKNAVTTAKIRKQAVTGAKVKNRTLTGKQINAATLGTVPSATLADSIPPAEATHLVGAPGEPEFENGSLNSGSKGPLKVQSVGFYKDHEGIVHLQGVANVDTGPGLVSVFTLPPGYRPAPGVVLEFEQIKELTTLIGGSNTNVEGASWDGKVMGAEKGKAVLDGIVFRAES